MKKGIRYLCSVMAVAILTVGLAACGGGGGGGGGGATAPATLLVTSSDGAPLASTSGFVSKVFGEKAAVDSSLVTSLTIDVTKITVHHAGSDDDGEEETEEELSIVAKDHDEEEVEGPDETDGQGWLTLFEALLPEEIITLDLVNLQALSQVLTSANLPVGKYTKIAIYYENPVLTIDDDNDAGTPDVVTSAIQRTANGRLFVSQNFELEEDEPVLIVIDFENIGLADAGSSPTHDYVLTPQLRVSIDITSAEAEVEGVIVDITEEPMGISVDNGEAIFDVVITEETLIYGEFPEVALLTRSDEEIPLTFADLALGQEVEVEGELQLDGSIVADEIEIEVEEIVALGTIGVIDLDGGTITIVTSTGDLLVSVGVGTEVEISSDVDIELTLEDLVVGLSVEVEYVEREDGTNYAVEFEVEAEENVVGEITAVGVDTITVLTTGGSEVVNVVSGTEIRDDVTDTLVFGDLVVGQLVDIRGATLAGDVFVARRIVIDGVV